MAILGLVETMFSKWLDEMHMFQFSWPREVGLIVPSGLKDLKLFLEVIR